MSATMLKASLLLLSVAASASAATTRITEDEMFGGPAAATAPAAQNQGVENPGEADQSGSRSLERSNPDEAVLQIGGSFSSQIDYYLRDATPLQDDVYSNPNILFLYLDSKLEQDSRIFARARLFYDPTGISGGTPGTVSLTNPYGLGSGLSENMSATLQELRLSANIEHRVFFTLGRQKVKYGAAKFFNPTDFLNAQAFNFFLPSDERTGVDMLKVHVPVGTANLYAMGLSGNPTNGNPSGGYVRGELAYNGFGTLIGNGEMSVSGMFAKNQPSKFGFDISQSVGDLDVYFEAAAGQDAKGDWQDATSTGLGWDVKYGERAANVVTLQAEFFQAGAFAEYGVFAFYLPEPANLKHTTLIESNLYSLMDKTGLSRLDLAYQFTTQITGRVYGAGHWGTPPGAFHTAGQAVETGARVDVGF